MQRNFRFLTRGRFPALAIIFLLTPCVARAQSLRDKFQGLAVNVPGNPTWIESNNHFRHFWYRKSVPGGYEFIIVDADALTKKRAFDHEKLAAAISAASGAYYQHLPWDFFVHNLLGVEPPDWNRTAEPAAAGPATTKEK